MWFYELQPIFFWGFGSCFASSAFRGDIVIRGELKMVNIKEKKAGNQEGEKNNINRLLLLEIIKYRVFHCGSWLIKKTVKSLQQTICLLKKVLAKTRIKHWVNYSWIMFKMIPCISLIQAPPDHRLKDKCCYLGTTESCSSTEKLFAILKLSSSSQALLTSKSTTEFPNREVTKQHI